MVHYVSLLLAPFAIATLSSLPAQKVEWWQKDFDSALTASEDSTAAMLLLYFWRDPDQDCTAMFGGTLADEKVASVISEYLCMGAKRGTDAGDPLFEKYRIEQVPTVLFLKPDGSVVDVVAGYVPVATFLDEAKRIKAGKETVAALREAAAQKPNNFELQLQLVRKLRAAGDKPASLEVIEAIVKKDPKLRNEYAAEAMLMKLDDELFASGSSPKDYELEPLRAFLVKQKNKRIRFLGYDRMATVEYARENLKAAAKHAQRAWKDIPKDQVLPWGQRMASMAYRHREELGKLDKGFLKLALVISSKAMKEVEREQKKTPDKTFHANSLWRHAAVLIINNKRKEAFAAMDKAMEIDPDNKNLKEAKARWVSGEK